jgi:uncharacterized membrane protein YeaQ/YmgE (transglycosylase-associated protein family)
VVLLVLGVLLLLFVVLPLLGFALHVVITAVVTGLVVGGLGRLAVPGRQSVGLLVTMALGLGGAFLGTLLARALQLHSLARFLLEVLAAAVLVAVVTGGGRSRRRGGTRQRAAR